MYQILINLLISGVSFKGLGTVTCDLWFKFSWLLGRSVVGWLNWVELYSNEIFLTGVLLKKQLSSTLATVTNPLNERHCGVNQIPHCQLVGYEIVLSYLSRWGVSLETVGI